MTVPQLLVTLLSALTVAGLARYFFRTRAVAETVAVDGVQEVHITVKGGYSPDAVRAQVGVPLRIVFDRQEEGDCSARVVFPDLAVSHWLAPNETTVVDLTFDRPGSFGFNCGMNMIHGTLLVEGEAPGERVGPSGSATTPSTTTTPPSGQGDREVHSTGNSHDLRTGREDSIGDQRQRLLKIRQPC